MKIREALIGGAKNLATTKAKEILPKKWQVWAALGATASVALGFAISEKVDANQAKASDASTMAWGLASSRNTCSIKNVTPVKIKGKPELSIVIDVKPVLHPNTVKDSRYDGLGIDVSFKDSPQESTVQGVRVTNATHAKEPQRSMLFTSPTNSPDGPENKITTYGPLVTPDLSRYEVYRENAVEDKADIRFGEDLASTQIGRVSCGSFVYRPGQIPVF